MTNRERILKTNVYDFLMDLNSNVQSNDYRCIKECLTNEYQFQGHHRCIICDHDCSECIQDWLNEEAK